MLFDLVPSGGISKIANASFMEHGKILPPKLLVPRRLQYVYAGAVYQGAFERT